MPTYPELIAEAVEPVPGVTGYAYPPDLPLAGSCWTQWAGIPEPQQYADGDVDVSMSDWDVILVLPAANDRTTYDALGSQLPDVLRAVSPYGQLGPVTPKALAVADGRTVPCVSIRITEGI